MTDERALAGLDIDGAPMDAAELEDGPGLVTPDGIDQGELLDALYRDLRRGEHAKSVLVEAQMRRVIEASQSLGEAGFVEGIGQLVARVPAAVFHHWGQRYGYEIWNNPGDLIRHLERLNPGFLVRSRGKPQVVIDGLKTSPAVNTSAAGVGELDAAARPAPAGRAVLGRRGRWAAN